MPKLPDYDKLYIQYLNQEIRRILIDCMSGKLTCEVYVTTKEGRDLADALPGRYLK
jgi:hypothetical protein